MQLRNKINKGELKKRILEDSTPRTTISFYRYVNITKPKILRDDLYIKWSELGVLGRIYLAREGINAQFSVPTENIKKFTKQLYSYPEFTDIPFKIAVEDDGKSFYKLDIKIKKKIVADGLDDKSFDTANVGKHLTAKEWNELMSEEDTIVVDMRNHYESEIGHFKGAYCPDADTFREELQIVKEELVDKKDKKILLYCTGGIRCEKASAFLKSENFQDVNQLHGGIIDYARQCKEERLENNFLGKNFVFDSRVAERISAEVISNCHQCDNKSDTHTNCANNACHLLFIQCGECKQKYDGCCTPDCQKIANLPRSKQESLRKGKSSKESLAVYKSRLRPNLKDILKTA